jgi:hypothetical protein
LSGKERGQRDKGTKIIFFLNLKRRMGWNVWGKNISLYHLRWEIWMKSCRVELKSIFQFSWKLKISREFSWEFCTFWEDKKNICVVMLEFSCRKGWNENVRFRIAFLRKFSRNFSLWKVTKIAGKLIIWTTWGMGHKIE